MKYYFFTIVNLLILVVHLSLIGGNLNAEGARLDNKLIEGELIIKNDKGDTLLLSSESIVFVKNKTGKSSHISRLGMIVRDSECYSNFQSRGILFFDENGKNSLTVGNKKMTYFNKDGFSCMDLGLSDDKKTGSLTLWEPNKKGDFQASISAKNIGMSRKNASIDSMLMHFGMVVGHPKGETIYTEDIQNRSKK